jgi:Zn-dependent protease
MFGQGLTTLFSLRGIPVRVHFSVVLGFLFVSGARFAPGAWLGYFVLVCMHELGHALLARRYRLQVYDVIIHGLGGYCTHEGTDSAFQRSVIAWGGVLAQLLLFVAAAIVSGSTLGHGMLFAAVSGQDYVGYAHTLANDFLGVMLSTNLLIIALNLLPLRGLDGHDAWRLPRLAYQRWQKARIRKRLAKPKRAAGTQPPRPQAAEPKLKLVRDASGDFRFEREEEREEN